MSKKIVSVGAYWCCDSLDLLANITEEGIALLLNDGTTIFCKNGEQRPRFELATESEKKAYGNALGFVYPCDLVFIEKGKLKGSFKQVVNTFDYIVPNTYGKAKTTYLVFADGTKTNILNCLINEKRVIKFDTSPRFSVGGRI